MICLEFMTNKSLYIILYKLLLLILIVYLFKYLYIKYQKKSFSIENFEVTTKINGNKIDLQTIKINNNSLIRISSDLLSEKNKIIKIFHDEMQIRFNYIKNIFGKYISDYDSYFLYNLLYKENFSKNQNEIETSIKVVVDSPQKILRDFSNLIIRDKKNFLSDTKEIMDFHYKEMHEFIEKTFKKTVFITSDPLTRWLVEGLSEYYSIKYLKYRYPKFKIQNFSPYSQKSFENFDLITWTFPFEFGFESFDKSKKIIIKTDKSFDKSFNRNIINYDKARTLFLNIDIKFGEKTISQIISSISQKKDIRSEDVVKIIESIIGKNELENLIGKNYYNRIIKHRYYITKKLIDKYKNNKEVLIILFKDIIYKISDESKKNILNILSESHNCSIEDIEKFKISQ